MADPVSYPGLLTSLLVPWLTGTVVTLALLYKSGRWNWFTVTGQGYFVGIFFATLLMRLSDWAGAGLHFWGLVLAIAFIGTLGMLVQFRRRPSAVPVRAPLPAARWHIAVAAILLALLSLRYLTLVQELLLRPLYAWDAWMNWAPKSIVWFHLGELAKFVTPSQWLDNTGELQAYTLGNAQASPYPPTVPLILLWSMLGAGTWDHGTVYLPWLLAALNLGLALYGHLRLARLPLLPAVTACYLLLSLPYLNVHIALAGYADLWLAACFGLAAFALHEWQHSRAWPYAALCLFLVFMCAQLKNPGIALGIIILIALTRSALELGRKTELALTLLVIVLSGVILAVGLVVDIPLLGRVAISATGVSLPVLGDVGFEYHATWNAFRQAMFVMINWNLLFYFAALLLLLKMYRGDLRQQASVELFVLALTSAFLVVVFAFTRHFQEALNFITLNRALLYGVPILVFYLFLQLQRLFPPHVASNVPDPVDSNTAGRHGSSSLRPR